MEVFCIIMFLFMIYSARLSYDDHEEDDNNDDEEDDNNDDEEDDNDDEEQVKEHKSCSC